MKEKRGGILLIIIFIVIAIAIIGIFVVLYPRRGEIQNINESKTKYSKSSIIDLINSKTNKTNYEVEYTLPKEYIGEEKKYNYKILNNKQKLEYITSEKTIIIYYDFEENRRVIIDENNKRAIISEISYFYSGSYYDEEITYILDPDCKIDKEEKIFNRDAVVLNYDVNEKYVLFGEEIMPISNMKMWIDTETGLLVQSVVQSKGKEIKTVYNVKLNEVTEDDVAIPDLTGYEVSDIRKT